MGQQRRLTAAEWEIMEGIWKLGVRTIAREVHSLLYAQGQKAFSTVQTVLNILVRKGFLKKEKIGEINFYTALVSREEAGWHETDSLVSRIYQGSFGALVISMVGAGKVSRKELEEIKAQIRAKELEWKKRRR